MAVSKRKLTDEMAAEVRGFFFGEGHLDLSNTRHGNGLSPRARVGLRDDDKPVLDWLMALFGGSCHRRAATRSWCWQLVGATAMRPFVEVLQGGAIPSKKRREVELMAEAIDLVPVRGAHISPDAADRLWAIRDELKSVRSYREAVK